MILNKNNYLILKSLIKDISLIPNLEQNILVNSIGLLQDSELIKLKFLEKHYRLTFKGHWVLFLNKKIHETSNS